MSEGPLWQSVDVQQPLLPGQSLHTQQVSASPPQLGQHASSGIAKETHSGFGLFQGSPGNSRVVPYKEKKMTVAVSPHL